MDDLIAFLNARLDEDEAAARLAAREGGTWTQDDPERHPGSISSLGGQVVYDEGAPDENQAPHIARHDPARVLREVEAKRRMLTELKDEIDGMDAQIESEWGSGLGPIGESDLLLKLLGLPYSDHPGYRQEWKP